jgi:hypothetical protein
LNGYLIVSDQAESGSTIKGHYAWTNHDMSQLDGGHQARSDAIGWTSGQVAAGPGEYLYVWVKWNSSSDSDIYARRFDADGKPLGPAGGFLFAGEGDAERYWMPQVAYAGLSGYLVVWTHNVNSTLSNVFGAYVPPGEDQVAGEPFPIFDDASDQWATSLACAPWGICLVAIIDRDNAGADLDIKGKLVRPCAKAYVPIVVR